MAITAAQVAVAIRAATAADQVPDEVSMVLGFLVPAAVEIIEHFAPEAPQSVKDAALIRLAGWLWDAEPTDPSIGRGLQVSGAAPLLSRWRVHRAGAIGTADASGGTVPQGAGLPPLPADGNFILTVQDGTLTWVEFPLPS